MSIDAAMYDPDYTCAGNGGCCMLVGAAAIIISCVASQLLLGLLHLVR